MVSSDQLAKILQAVNVEQVAELAGCSTKTVYRLRHRATSSSLSRVEKLVEAARKLNPGAVAAVLLER